MSGRVKRKLSEYINAPPVTVGTVGASEFGGARGGAGGAAAAAAADDDDDENVREDATIRVPKVRIQ